MITWNCLQQDLAKTLKGGFNTGHGFLREPNSIRAAAALACIAIQSSQNDMLGGQSISCWDGALAPYVDKSFRKAFRGNLEKVISVVGCYDFGDTGSIDTLKKEIKSLPESYIPAYVESFEKRDAADGFDIGGLCRFISEKLNGANFTAREVWQVWNLSCRDVEEETKQAMEAAIHNFNSLHSRAGSQTPFSSLNYGLDTTPEGRLVTRMTLEAIWEGLGHGETPIFPISIFLLKSGVNYNPGDPNYDLFKEACKVSAKRLFPNFLSQDAPFNIKYYKEGDYKSYVTAMGCRTRVVSNVNGPEESSSRGNFAFVTVNLPMLALMAEKDEKKFFKLLDKYVMLSRRYLEFRYSVISHKKVKNFPFVMGQHLWMGSEELGPEDEIGPALKHASLSIGFCGLAECLVALIGKHHGESDEAQQLGLKIVRHIRHRCDEYTNETHMNWTCFSTPAESTAGSFLRATRKKFGNIPGITDHDYFTNSFHKMNVA